MEWGHRMQEATSVERQQQERAIAQAFIRPDRRDRFVELAGSRSLDRVDRPSPREIKRRSRYTTMLANLEHWFDPRCRVVAIDGHSHATRVLAELGVPGEGYAMSADHQLDGRVLGWGEAFSHLAERYVYGTLIVSVASGVAYYEQSELAKLTRILCAVGLKP